MFAEGTLQVDAEKQMEELVPVDNLLEMVVMIINLLGKIVIVCTPMCK